MFTLYCGVCIYICIIIFYILIIIWIYILLIVCRMFYPLYPCSLLTGMIYNFHLFKKLPSSKIDNYNTIIICVVVRSSTCAREEFHKGSDMCDFY